MKEEIIKVNKSGRYFTLGSPTEKIKSIWIVLHGYGNLASEFLNNFKILDNGENFIIAPEALNKFYLKGFYGKIGAAWMTKEDRENEIDDYINFLDSVLSKEIRKFDRSKIKINVLGFSQGCPTAIRWLGNANFEADSLILWAGDIPTDSDPGKLIPLLKKLKIYFAAGRSDKIINEGRVKDELGKISDLGLTCSVHRFDGGHEINADTLREIVSDLNASK